MGCFNRYPDPYVIHFSPSRGHYWWSHKAYYIDTMRTEVPRELLGLLFDSWYSYVRRNRPYWNKGFQGPAKRPKIHWDQQRQVYYWNSGIYLPEREVEDWLTRNGHEDLVLAK